MDKSGEHSLKALLVEDNPGDALLIKQLLLEKANQLQATSRSIELIHAESLSAGRERLTGGDIDVVLLDLSLPDSHGIETFSSLHRQEPQVPIVVLTGLADEKVALEAMKLGAQDYLAKGKVDGHGLRRSIEYAVERQLASVHLREKTRMLRATEARFRKIIEENADGIVVLDREGTVLFVNQAAESLLGRPADEMIGEPFGFSVVLKITTELEIRRTNSDSTIVEMNVVETQWEGESVYLATLRDITERKRVEVELQQLKDFNEGIVQTMAEGLMIADSDGIITFINPTGEALIGYAREELLGEHFSKILPEDQVPVVEAARRRRALGETDHYETALLHKDGREVPVLVSGSPLYEEGRFAGSLGVWTDITKLKQVEAELHYGAFHDSLTGLPNRALLFDRLEQVVARAKRQTHTFFALLFMDLDHFKVVNDSLGHSIGDELLVVLGRRLQRCVRPSDTVARLGGDEFGVLLDGIRNANDAIRIVERIQEALNSPFSLSGNEVFISASIGIALSTTGYRKPEDLLRNADIAMYQAKEKGRGQHEVYDRTMHAHAIARLRLENDLRRAVDRQEFMLHYQPIVLLQTGEISSFEALIRWNHPTEGMKVASDFIFAAEETGLILSLDRWVIHEACRQLKVWKQRLQRDCHLSIGVNLSYLNFRQSDIDRLIIGTLEDLGIDPSCLRLEITEGALMQDAEAAAEVLLRLKDRGISLCIDDFGTGMSSLSSLHRFPLDAMKIDRSFIQRIDANGENIEIVRTIAGLAESLGIAVIAEGLETTDQLSRLMPLNLRRAQGFLFSEPVDGQTALSLVQDEAAWRKKLSKVLDSFAGNQ